MVTIREVGVEDVDISRQEQLIDPGVSFEDEQRLDKISSESEEIREKAMKILETYNIRLNKVGANPFQIRLNIFFTFVKKTSVEAEAYDYLQSVEGSVMNHSDDDDIIERVYERTSSRLSAISNF